MKTAEEIYDDCKHAEYNNLNYKFDWNKKWYSEDEIKKLLNVFIGEISESKQHREEIVELAKDIFGEEMIDER